MLSNFRTYISIDQLFTVKRPHFTSPQQRRYRNWLFNDYMAYVQNKWERRINRKCVIAQPISGFHLITKHLLNTMRSRIHISRNRMSGGTSQTETKINRAYLRLKCPAAMCIYIKCAVTTLLSIFLSILFKCSKSSSGSERTLGCVFHSPGAISIHGDANEKKYDSGKVRWSNFLRYAPSIKPPDQSRSELLSRVEGRVSPDSTFDVNYELPVKLIDA